MEEKNSVKVSLGTAICIFIIFILIIVICGMYFYYNNKNTTIVSNEKENITNSEKPEIINNNISSVNNEIDNLNIDNDVEVSLSEIENIGNANIDQLKAFYNKYKGKIIKISGYVAYWGDKYDLGSEYATGVNIGNSTTYETRTYVSGIAQSSNVIQFIHNLKNGQKIGLIGKLSAFESQPITINLMSIVEE